MPPATGLLPTVPGDGDSPGAARQDVPPRLHAPPAAAADTSSAPAAGNAPSCFPAPSRPLPALQRVKSLPAQLALGLLYWLRVPLTSSIAGAARRGPGGQTALPRPWPAEPRAGQGQRPSSRCPAGPRLRSPEHRKLEQSKAKCRLKPRQKSNWRDLPPPHVKISARCRCKAHFGAVAHLDATDAHTAPFPCCLAPGTSWSEGRGETPGPQAPSPGPGGEEPWLAFPWTGIVLPRSSVPRVAAEEGVDGLSASLALPALRGTGRGRLGCTRTRPAGLGEAEPLHLPPGSRPRLREGRGV